MGRGRGKGRGGGGRWVLGALTRLSRVGWALSLEEKMIPGLKGLWGLKEGDPGLVTPRGAQGGRSRTCVQTGELSPVGGVSF